MTSVHSNASLCNDCDHTVFVSSMFTLSVTKAESQPNVVSHYGQVYISQKVCVSGLVIIGLLFFVFWWVLPPLKIFFTFLTPCIHGVPLIIRLSRK